MSNFEYKLQILEHHLDSLGHVNNAVYLELFEQARWDFITKGGYGIDQFIKLQKAPVVLEVNMRFKKELINREFVTIRTTNSDYSGKVFKMTQEMIKDDGSVACIADFTVGFMDLAKRKLINPTEEWLKAVHVQ